MWNNQKHVNDLINFLNKKSSWNTKLSIKSKTMMDEHGRTRGYLFDSM